MRGLTCINNNSQVMKSISVNSLSDVISMHWSGLDLFFQKNCKICSLPSVILLQTSSSGMVGLDLFFEPA